MLAAGADGTFDQQIYIPLGLLYMASVLRQRGGNVELIDYQLFSQARRFDVDGLTATIGQTAPIVGISWLRHSNVPTPHGE
jgi:hypothetical protein